MPNIFSPSVPTNVKWLCLYFFVDSFGESYHDKKVLESKKSLHIRSGKQQKSCLISESHIFKGVKVS